MVRMEKMNSLMMQTDNQRPRRSRTLRCFSLASSLMVAFLGAFDAPGASDSAPAESRRNVGGIMDNSFLVEEAYNQEPGVVQHIFTAFYSVDKLAGPDDKILSLGFTQEWPVFSQTHQFSYTIPYSFVDAKDGSEDGLGDILLNYRYQAYFNERNLRAFAPRLSLVLPTGDEKRGFGDDTLGYQLNLPFSTAIGNSWFAHLNAGLTYLPDAGSSSRHDLLHYNLGGSLIYAATRDVHFMLEWVGAWIHVPKSTGGLDREFASIISPGVRKAFNFANDSQLVLGVAAPIGLTRAAPDFGVFLYLSFEHFFHRKK
jgi:hypothetical protein